MSIKKPTDLPVLPANVDRWITSAGKPTANILDTDVFQVSISGEPGAAFPGGTIYPTGRSSVQVKFSELVAQIGTNLSIAQIVQAADDLADVVTDINAEIDGIDSQISDISADILELSSIVPSIIANVSQVSANVQTLELSASTAESNISDLQATNVIFESELSALQASNLVLSADLYELQVCAVVSSAMVYEYDAVGPSGAQVSAEAWNAQVGDGYESSALAFSTGEFLRVQFGDPKITRYIPLYIFSSDYTSG